MIIYKRYGIALNSEENEKLKKVKDHYKTGVKKIFMGMVNAMHGRIPAEIPKVIVEETE